MHNYNKVVCGVNFLDSAFPLPCFYLTIQPVQGTYCLNGLPMRNTLNITNKTSQQGYKIFGIKKMKKCFSTFVPSTVRSNQTIYKLHSMFLGRVFKSELVLEKLKISISPMFSSLICLQHCATLTTASSVTLEHRRRYRTCRFGQEDAITSIPITNTRNISNSKTYWVEMYVTSYVTRYFPFHPFRYKHISHLNRDSM